MNTQRFTVRNIIWARNINVTIKRLLLHGIFFNVYFNNLTIIFYSTLNNISVINYYTLL